MSGSIFHRLYHGETTFDFVGKRKIGFSVSAVFLLLSLGFLGVRGLNLGIDFEGGVSWEFDSNDTTTDQVEAVLEANGINPVDAKIQTLQGSTDRIRVQTGDQTPETESAVKAALSSAASGAEVSVSTVSPTWGSEITKKALQALGVFFVLIAAYIAWRFEWKMAVAAIAAVVHDVFISVGIYAIFGFEVTPATVIAFLTILGFSLYDTIVVFDKVLDNTNRLGTRVPYPDIVNLSMNQVLMRSLNTSLAAVLPVLSILVIGAWGMGAIALQEFALALLVGLITGSYSSIYIATPILAILKEREPRYQELSARRNRSESLQALRHTIAEEDAPAKSKRTAAVTMIDRPLAGETPEVALSHPPRPRKKKRR